MAVAVKDLAYLSRYMYKAAAAVDDDVNNFVKAVSQEVHFEVDERTPVDTGRARSNWIVRIGRAWNLVYRPFAPGRHLGRGERANLNAAVAQAKAVLARRKTDETVYITNNLPYINRLNQGYSRQSPSGFVQSGISVGIGKAKQNFTFKKLRRI